MLNIICPECGENLKIPEQYLGQWGNCNHCGKKIQVLVSPPKFSKEVYELEDEVPEETLSPILSSASTINNQEPVSSAYEPFTFDNSNYVGDTQEPVYQQANKPNVADVLGQLGKTMTGCGCYLLLAPFIIFMLILSYNLLFGSCNTETRNQTKTKKPEIAASKGYTGSQRVITKSKTVNLDNLFQIDTLLEVGSYYQFSGEIILMPEFEPSGFENTMSAIARMLRFSGQSSWILIRGVKFKEDTPWYQVDAFYLNGSQIGSGWINATSLLGDTVIKHSANTNATVPNPTTHAPSTYQSKP